MHSIHASIECFNSLGGSTQVARSRRRVVKACGFCLPQLTVEKSSYHPLPVFAKVILSADGQPWLLKWHRLLCIPSISTAILHPRRVPPYIEYLQSIYDFNPCRQGDESKGRWALNRARPVGSLLHQWITRTLPHATARQPAVQIKVEVRNDLHAILKSFCFVLLLHK